MRVLPAPTKFEYPMCPSFPSSLSLRPRSKRKRLPLGGCPYSVVVVAVVLGWRAGGGRSMTSILVLPSSLSLVPPPRLHSSLPKLPSSFVLAFLPKPLGPNYGGGGGSGKEGLFCFPPLLILQSVLSPGVPPRPPPPPPSGEGERKKESAKAIHSFKNQAPLHSSLPSRLSLSRAYLVILNYDFIALGNNMPPYCFVSQSLAVDARKILLLCLAHDT